MKEKYLLSKEEYYEYKKLKKEFDIELGKRIGNFDTVDTHFVFYILGILTMLIILLFLKW